MGESTHHFEHWDVLDELSKGGQGQVFKVLQRSRPQDIDLALQGLCEFVRSSAENAPQLAERLPNVIPILQTLLTPHDPQYLGALKRFEIPEDDKEEAARAVKRLEHEIRALAATGNQPGILRLLDSDLKARSIVTEYHAGGTLTEHLDRYRGDALGALLAFRPLVQAVAALHSRQEVIVHRDIKPDNIFVTSDGRLVLGDFGIVFFRLDGLTRATATHERVGSRDWMAPWANIGRRIEDVNPSFDVFPLGKVLWCMISGQSGLPFWYHSRDAYDLERLFPNAPEMAVINALLDRCVVEEEEYCLKSGVELLVAVDGALRTLPGLSACGH